MDSSSIVDIRPSSVPAGLKGIRQAMLDTTKQSKLQRRSWRCWDELTKTKASES